MKKTQVFVLINEQVIENAVRAVKSAPVGAVVTIKPERRSISQNDLSHVWYSQIASELPEDDALGWKAYCKLHHGVPILRAEDEEFRDFYDRSIKSMDYERKLAAMKYLPVTSLMTKDQLSRYLESVQEDFRKRGVNLLFPDEVMA